MSLRNYCLVCSMYFWKRSYNLFFLSKTIYMSSPIKDSSEVEWTRKKMLTVGFYIVCEFLNLVKRNYNRNVKHSSVTWCFYVSLLEKYVCNPVFLCFPLCALPLWIFLYMQLENQKVSAISEMRFIAQENYFLVLFLPKFYFSLFIPNHAANFTAYLS